MHTSTSGFNPFFIRAVLLTCGYQISREEITRIAVSIPSLSGQYF